jgi:hypothetical protein
MPLEAKFDPLAKLAPSGGDPLLATSFFYIKIIVFSFMECTFSLEGPPLGAKFTPKVKLHLFGENICCQKLASVVGGYIRMKKNCGIEVYNFIQIEILSIIVPKCAKHPKTARNPENAREIPGGVFIAS